MSADFMRADWPAPKSVLAGTTLRHGDYELPAKPKLLRQVHGTRVVHLESDDFEDGPPEADAVVAHHVSDMCVVRTADCLPVLLCSRGGDEIAAIHAGWRGLSAGIVEKTVGRMRTVPSSLIAWLGPAISQANFEVGDEVRDAFLAHGPAAGAAFERNERGRWQADLYKLARQHLGATGVFDVYGGGLCTYGDAEHFDSYRRDGDEAGRMLSFVYLRF